MINLVYWGKLVKYRFLHNKFLKTCSREMSLTRETFVIQYRLRKKGYTEDEIHNAFCKFGRIRRIRVKKEDRVSRMMLNNVIAEMSDKTGVPQWQIREKVNDDFKLNL